MNIKFLCNGKEKGFTKKDVKKSDFLVEFENLNEGAITLSRYNKDTKQYDIIAERDVIDEKVVLEKELFGEKKYLINVIKNGKSQGAYSIEFEDKKKLFLLAIPALLVGVLCFALINNKEDGPSKVPTKLPGILDSNGVKGEGVFSDNIEEIQKALDESTQYLNVKISSFINIKRNKGFFKIYNSNEDKDIQVIFYRYDREKQIIHKEDILYISPLLHPNENVGEDKLIQDLKAGKHNVMAVFNAYDFDGNFLGNFSQEILLNVE